MAIQNTTDTNTEPLTSFQDDEASTAAGQPELKEELSDDEIAAVAAGHTGPINGAPVHGRIIE